MRAVSVRHACPDFSSYRAARVKSLFNVETGAEFSATAELPTDSGDWRIGVVVGPSGTGKTSIGRAALGERAFRAGCTRRWPRDRPIIDAISPDGPFDDVAAALSAVGLGTVPSWLRPFHVLSNGEQFRANLARVICERPARVVIDEFTSVVDRQIGRVGALAFAKAWRRTGGQAILLTCHYDVLDWIGPDWVLDTKTWKFHGRWVRPRPRIDVEIRHGNWGLWPAFEPHHYLKLPRMPASSCYVGFVDGEPVAHLAVSSASSGPGRCEARACRLVVMPEWQGAGVGMRFLNRVCQLQLEGRGHLRDRRVPTLFHTSHPGLAAALRRDPKWAQLSARLYGSRKRASAASIKRAGGFGTGYGGHFRAVQGFRYYGDDA